MSNQLKEFLEATGFSITGGTEYCWSCFGNNARYIDTEKGEHSASVIFDSVTQDAYEIHVSSEDDSNPPYRWINPDYLNAYKAEAATRGQDYLQFCDDIKWADTDTFEDIIEKIRAIYNGLEYDKRVVLSMDMPDDLFAMCARAAHERDITFNDFIAKAIQSAIDNAKGDEPLDSEV